MKTMAAKYNYYEVVEVISEKPENAEAVGLKGAILGMAEEEGIWSYSVYLFDKNESWSFNESDLESTGQFKHKEDFYDGEIVHVITDPETGEGKLSR